MAFIKSLALNGILIAIIAHGLVAVSLVWDKVLLQQRGMKNLASYVFWLVAISIFGLCLIPFGFHFPSAKIAFLALSAGFCDLVATYFYYAALKAGEASEELAALGGFIPLATVLLSVPLLGLNLAGQLTAFAVMTSGGFVMFFAEKLPLARMLPRVIGAATLFGLTDVLQKLAFNGARFVTGYVFFTIGTFAGIDGFVARSHVAKTDFRIFGTGPAPQQGRLHAEQVPRRRRVISGRVCCQPHRYQICENQSDRKRASAAFGIQMKSGSNALLPTNL